MARRLSRHSSGSGSAIYENHKGYGDQVKALQRSAIRSVSHNNQGDITVCAHATDEFGNALDPELRELEDTLCCLAGSWRLARGDSKRREEIVQEYHAAVARLYELGWDGGIDWECELPRQLMPEEYLRRIGLRPDSPWWEHPTHIP